MRLVRNNRLVKISTSDISTLKQKNIRNLFISKKINRYFSEEEINNRPFQNSMFVSGTRNREP